MRVVVLALVLVGCGSDGASMMEDAGPGGIATPADVAMLLCGSTNPNGTRACAPPASAVHVHIGCVQPGGYCQWRCDVGFVNCDGNALNGCERAGSACP
jgi:hypothetical protein